jgi:hypothetical protein
MTKQNSNSKDGQRRFSQEQYEMLLRCSEKKDMIEWNEWRREHPDEEILLEGANIAKARRVTPEQEVFSEAYLEDANLSYAHLEGADLRGAHLHGANFFDAHLEGAKLELAHLEDANLSKAHLKGAKLLATHLNRAELMFADLEEAILNSADLEGARLNWTDLRGTYLRYTHLKGTRFGQAIVDGFTSLWECEVDHDTDFRGVGLDNVRIDVGTKQLLEYNIRRKNWEEWYPKHPLLRWLVWAFWWMSDYGISTKRIVGSFFVLVFVFANIYYHWGRIAPPGIVDCLFVDRNGVPVEWWLVPLRTLYFSIVTMTTLGFGDMYANAHSVFGHILLSFQVILGYVLLGALVTRFAVLFMAGGPAGKFADEKGKPQDTQRRE